MSGREELAEVIRLELRKGRYQMPGDKLPYETQAASIAAMLLAAGYRKPKVLAYIVVGRAGYPLDRHFKSRETAQAFAEEWTAECKTAGIDWDYRVAEIVEPQP